jgi:TetR/AcrR family transcriptional regulator, transcriptional repressor for nem operon
MNKTTTREALIEVGLELISSTGYSATGVNQILDAAETRSFYNHFSNKEQFVIEVIKLYVTGGHEHMERLMSDADLSPLQKLRRYFEDMIATHGRRGGPIKGCLLGNLSLEVAGHNTEIRDALRESFNGWQEAIATTIREAVNEGELPCGTNANALAAVIVDTWQGAQVRAKTDQNDKALNLFLDSTFNLLLRTNSQLRVQ